ncbi:MAG: DUF975 family protein [Bifidobacteriaceae bacterium]|jgi:uncharacterized membrane protein|nr:DUF975 family protein [Bifidobacteriaceae bacterium]
MNIGKIKRSALDSLDGKKGGFIVPLIAYFFIPTVITLLGQLLFGHDFSILKSIVTILGWFVGATLLLGMQKMVKDTIQKGESPDMDNLFFAFKSVNLMVRAFLIELLTYLYTILWMCLLIVPGVIAQMSYIATWYIALDHPELTPNQCIGKSKELTKGYKWQIFLFVLSFLGWAILSLFTFGLLMFWLYPYINASQVKLYETLMVLNGDKVFGNENNPYTNADGTASGITFDANSANVATANVVAGTVATETVSSVDSAVDALIAAATSTEAPVADPYVQANAALDPATTVAPATVDPTPVAPVDPAAPSSEYGA